MCCPDSPGLASPSRKRPGVSLLLVEFAALRLECRLRSLPTYVARIHRHVTYQCTDAVRGWSVLRSADTTIRQTHRAGSGFVRKHLYLGLDGFSQRVLPGLGFFNRVLTKDIRSISLCVVTNNRYNHHAFLD